MSEKQKELLRAVKFTLFSVSAAIIQIVAIFIARIFIEQEDVCYAIGLILSVLWNFTLNRKITFQSANNVPIAMLKVAAFYVVFAPASTWAVGWLTGLGWSAVLADGLMMILNFVLEYLYDRFFVFRDSIDTAVTAEK